MLAYAGWILALKTGVRRRAYARARSRPTGDFSTTETNQVQTPRALGSFVIRSVWWNYAERDGAFELWSSADEVSTVDVAAASRKLRTLHDVKSHAIRITTVPSTHAVLGRVEDFGTLRERYDNALMTALPFLGVDASGYDTGGMPSEYRAWMWYAFRVAARYLWVVAKSPDAPSHADERAAVAAEVLAGTAAVSVSMREGHTTLAFTMAVALKGLVQAMQDVRLIPRSHA